MPRTRLGQLCAYVFGCALVAVATHALGIWLPESLVWNLRGFGDTVIAVLIWPGLLGLVRPAPPKNTIQWADFVQRVRNNMPEDQRDAAQYALELAIVPTLPASSAEGVAVTQLREDK